MTTASTTCMATPTLTQHIVDNVDNKGLTSTGTGSPRRGGASLQARFQPQSTKKSACLAELSLARTPQRASASKNFGREPVEPRALAIEGANEARPDHARDGTAKDVRYIVRSDINPGPRDQPCAGEKKQCPTGQSLQRKGGGNRAGGRCVIRWERPVAAPVDDEPSETGVVRAHAMDEQEMELIEAKADQERELGGDRSMSHMPPFRRTPPLQDDEQNHDRNPKSGHGGRKQIEKRIAPRGRVYPLRDR